MSFTSFFSGLGHGIKNAANTVGHGISSIAKPALSMAGQMAPLAGTVMGGYFGGPGGAMMGSQLGGMVGNMINQPSSATQMASQLGGMMQDYLPPEYQGKNFGQMGQQFSGYLNNQMPGAGDLFGGAMSMVPESYLSRNMSNFMGPMENSGGSYAPGMDDYSDGYSGEDFNNPAMGDNGYNIPEDAGWYQGKLQPGQVGAFYQGGHVRSRY